MEYLMLVATALMGIFALNFTKHKEIVRIEWDKVASFIAFMVVLTFGRIAFFDLMMQLGIMKTMPGLPPEIMYSKWTLFLVFWEDFFFGLPIYLIHKYSKGFVSKWLKWPLTVAISFMFAMGHGYQGLSGIAITSLYPYFVSKRYGEKYGFGTVAICHILYDNVTVYSIILMPYLLG